MEVLGEDLSENPGYPGVHLSYVASRLMRVEDALALEPHRSYGHDQRCLARFVCTPVFGNRSRWYVTFKASERHTPTSSSPWNRCLHFVVKTG